MISASRSDQVVKDASLSRCGKFRWALTRRWGVGKQICWVMLNPSSADHRRDDPTILRTIKFTRLWGFAALTVVNLYPFRSSRPPECRRWAQSAMARQAMERNAAIVAHEAHQAALVVAAWGGHAWDVLWVNAILDAILTGPTAGPEIYCLGRTKTGCPKHPLARGKHRIPDDQQPVLWRSKY